MKNLNNKKATDTKEATESEKATYNPHKATQTKKVN